MDAHPRSQIGLDFRRCLSDVLNRQIDEHPSSEAALVAAFGFLGHVLLLRRPDSKPGPATSLPQPNRLNRLIFDGAITRQSTPAAQSHFATHIKSCDFASSHGAVLELVLWSGARSEVRARPRPASILLPLHEAPQE